MQNLSCKVETDLCENVPVDGTHFTCMELFGIEAKGMSEMTYLHIILLSASINLSRSTFQQERRVKFPHSFNDNFIFFHFQASKQ